MKQVEQLIISHTQKLPAGWHIEADLVLIGFSQTY
jgi:hypothetical protein